MNNGVYNAAGMRPNENGRIDSLVEVKNFLKGIPEGEKLERILSLFPVRIEVTDIEALTADQLDGLRPGDVVIKKTGNEDHTYTVSYKDAVKGELSLTYADHNNVEEVYYEKTGGVWGHVITENTHIGA